MRERNAAAGTLLKIHNPCNDATITKLRYYDGNGIQNESKVINSMETAEVFHGYEISVLLMAQTTLGGEDTNSDKCNENGYVKYQNLCWKYVYPWNGAADETMQCKNSQKSIPAPGLISSPTNNNNSNQPIPTAAKVKVRNDCGKNLKVFIRHDWKKQGDAAKLVNRWVPKNKTRQYSSWKTLDFGVSEVWVNGSQQGQDIYKEKCKEEAYGYRYIGGKCYKRIEDRPDGERFEGKICTDEKTDQKTTKEPSQSPSESPLQTPTRSPVEYRPPTPPGSLVIHRC